ncbi:MAG: PAS domain S-box protein [Planctomycetes bacterium]|nr:PAS domain S-box protein [Planctomycetota bacterium]
MGSPLRVLAVDLADADVARLNESLRASGFTPDVQRAADPAAARGELERGCDLVVLSGQAPAAVRDDLAAAARGLRRPAYVLRLDDLLDAGEGEAAAGAARLSSVLARRALGGRTGLGRDAGWVFDLLNTGRSEVYVVDAQTLRVRYANHEATRNTGFAREALQEMTLFQLAADADEATYRRLLEPVVSRERDVVSFEREHRRADGGRYPVELHLRWFERDRTAVLVAIGQDQSRPRAAERSLARAQVALEGVRDAVLVVSPAGVIEAANEAAARTYRRPVEELVGLRAQDLAAPGEATRASLQEGGQGPRGRSVVRTVHRRGDGGLFEAEVVQHAGDGVTALVVRDVTEARKLAAAAEDAGEALRTLLQAAPDPVVLLDPAGRVTSWSRSAERLFGWSEAEVTGQPPPFVPPERAAEWQTLLELVQGGSALGPVQVVRRRRDGARVDVLLSLSPLRGRDRRPRGAVAVMADVTDRTRAEVERAHLTAALDLVPDEVLLVEPGSLLVQFANERAARASGLEPHAMVGLSLLELEPGVTPDAFVARAGAALLPGGAPARYETSLRAPGGGLRRREVELATVEHAGARVHALVAYEPPPPGAAAPSLLHAALRVAGLGLVEVDEAGGVVDLDAGARDLLRLDPAAAPATLADLARLARAPALVEAWERLARADGRHACVRVAGAADALEVSAVAAPGGRRALVLAPAADELGLVAALLEGLRRAAEGLALAEVARPACEWLARHLPAEAVWFGAEGGGLAVAGPAALEVGPRLAAALADGPPGGLEGGPGAPIVLPLADAVGARVGWAGAFVEPGGADAAARALAVAGSSLVTLLLVARELEGLRLRALALDATGAAVVVADPAAHVLWSTPGAEHTLALSPPARAALARGEPAEERAEHAGHPVVRRVVPVRGPGGDVARLVAVEREVTAHEAAEEAARRARAHDPVTGLPTRSALPPAPPDGAALALELDRAWELRAALGDAAVDAVLAEAAARLGEALGPHGALARGRGDAIVALLPGGPDLGRGPARSRGRPVAALRRARRRRPPGGPRLDERRPGRRRRRRGAARARGRGRARPGPRGRPGRAGAQRRAGERRRAPAARPRAGLRRAWPRGASRRAGRRSAASAAARWSPGSRRPPGARRGSTRCTGRRSWPSPAAPTR